MDNYFDYEDVDEEKRMKYAMTKLRGHASLWWDELQANRKKRGKYKTKSWDKMVIKFKGKLTPKDYHLNHLSDFKILDKKLC